MSLLDDRSFDVVIVGGGPVGMGLAIDLGQRGVRCAVVERHTTPQQIPKGQNLTQRTMEHCFFWGVEQELRAARTVPKEYGIGGLTVYGTLLGDYRYDWLQRELVRPYYFTDNERLPQYETEGVLRHRATTLSSVEILDGWRAEEVTPHADGVTVVAVEDGGEDRQTLRGQFLVGCDGSRSMVRQQAAMTQTHSDHHKLMVLLLFRSTELHEMLERYPGKSYYIVLHPALKGYWQFFGRVDLGETWFFHAPVPAGTTEDNFDFRRYLHRAVGAEFELDFDYVGFWDLRFAIADNYRRGRVFIAGDAAHSHPPYGGYGINTGFEDARNLGWKLAAVLQGWGTDLLLDTYDEERRPVFASTARDFIDLSINRDREFLQALDPERDREAFEMEWAARSSGATTEVDQFEPHYGGSSIVWGESGGVCGAKGTHSFVARAGHHLAPQPLSSGQNVFEELGQEFTLLALDVDAETIRSFERAAAELGVPLTIVSDTRTDGRDRYKADLVLVRPDHFVAWASDANGVDAREVLRKVTARS